jgi:hypothetical protein
MPAGVGDGQPGMAVLESGVVFEVDGDLATGWGVAAGVVEQVRQDLSEAGGVGVEG